MLGDGGVEPPHGRYAVARQKPYRWLCDPVRLIPQVTNLRDTEWLRLVSQTNTSIYRRSPTELIPPTVVGAAAATRRCHSSSPKLFSQKSLRVVGVLTNASLFICRCLSSAGRNAGLETFRQAPFPHHRQVPQFFEATKGDTPKGVA